jgi:hypothetical protein
MKKRCLVAKEEEYALIRGLSREMEIDYELAIELAVASIRDYKIFINHYSKSMCFGQHLESIVENVLDEHGTSFDDYTALYHFTEKLLYLCSQYVGVGLFKELADDGDWMYEVIHLPNDKMIIVMELT